MFRGFLGQFLDNMMGHRQNIEQIIDKDGASLEQVLSDGDIVTECKWGNQRVIKFFDREKIAQLVDYIIKMPPEGCTHDRGHKLPFVACEIFNCELAHINDQFFTSPVCDAQESLQSSPDNDKLKSPKKEEDEEIEKASPLKEEMIEDEEIENGSSQEIQIDLDFKQQTNDYQGIMAKTESQKSRSKRYEVEEEEEEKVESIEIDLQNDEEEDEENATDKKEQVVIEDEQQPSKQEQQQEQPVIQQQVEENTRPQFHFSDDEELAQEDLLNKNQQEQEEKQALIKEEGQQQEVASASQEIENATISTTNSTQQDQKRVKTSKYELFEYLLTFLDTDEALNPVLSGYFSKLFLVLISSKAKEVYQYVYKNPQVLDKLVKHIYQKSISEILVKLLNVSEVIAESDGIDYHELDLIRSSFIYKIVQQFETSQDMEVHLNTQIVLTELAEFKAVYQELISARCLELYKRYLSSNNEYAKQNIYLLLQILIKKNKFDSTQTKKKATFSNFQDGIEQQDDDEEDVITFTDPNNDFITFLKEITSECVTKDLQIPEEDQKLDSHDTTYGVCKKPFGILRIRIVEFLAQLYLSNSSQIHQIFADNDLYNVLLFYFEHYPYHNILHQKVSEIFILALDENNEVVVNHLLYQSHLIRKILDTAREGGIYTFQDSGKNLNKGNLVFIRKIANKLIEVQKQNEEVASFLCSIPEWTDYVENDLAKINLIESKPLASDPRKKSLSNDDDYFVFNFISKLKESKKDEEADNKEDNNEKDEVNFAQNEEEGEGKKSLRVGYQEQQEQEDDEEFERMMCRDENFEDQDNQQDDDQAQYKSNGRSDDNQNPLSLDDFAAEEERNQEYSSPSFRVAVEDSREEPEFHAQFYWKLEVAVDKSIDDLLQDYE